VYSFKNFILFVALVLVSCVNEKGSIKEIKDHNSNENKWTCIDSLINYKYLNRPDLAFGILSSGCSLKNDEVEFKELLDWSIYTNDTLLLPKLLMEIHEFQFDQLELNKRLFQSVNRKKTKAAMMFLELGADPNYVAEEGRLTINWAIIMYNDIEVIRTMLKKGAVVTLPEKVVYEDCEDCPFCYTAIHAAIDAYRLNPESGLETMSLLLDKVESAEDFCEGSGNPNNKAKHWNLDEVVKLLDEKGIH